MKIVRPKLYFEILWKTLHTHTVLSWQSPTETDQKSDDVLFPSSITDTCAALADISQKATYRGQEYFRYFTHWK